MIVKIMGIKGVSIFGGVEVMSFSRIAVETYHSDFFEGNPWVILSPETEKKIGTDVVPEGAKVAYKANALVIFIQRIGDPLDWRKIVTDGEVYLLNEEGKTVDKVSLR